MQSNKTTTLSIPDILELHGYDLVIIDDFLHTSLAQAWEYYKLVKGTIPKKDGDEMLLKLCHVQRLLCSVRSRWIAEN
jgi:hypothetical protein